MIRALHLVVSAVSAAALVAVLGLGVWAVLPAALGWRSTVVMTGSMAPRILPGDVVVSSPYQPADLVPGRVVMYTDHTRDGRLVVHRITDVNDAGQLITRGDANPSADAQPVAPADVVALPRLRVPFLGLPAVWLATGQWLPIGAVVAALALATHTALSSLVPARETPRGRRRADAPPARRRARRDRPVPA